nr:MAG TPA: hypothetical protein [Caudoviricetes sp.]
MSSEFQPPQIYCCLLLSTISIDVNSPIFFIVRSPVPIIASGIFCTVSLLIK